MTPYSRQQVLSILKINPRQLVGWERAGLISVQERYSFTDLAQLRTLRELQGLQMRSRISSRVSSRISPRSISNSVQAMRAVSGLSNPLLESAAIRTGTRLAFRHSGTMFDPITRQLFFDFESNSVPGTRSGPVSMLPPARTASSHDRALQALFLQAVQAEEQSRKPAAMELYNQILAQDPTYTAALINLGTLHYHQKNFDLAEQHYRRATVADPSYVLAFFDLGNVLDELQRPDESIAAYRRALDLAPGYADAHYNLALAFERKAERRRALAHWQIYIRLDKSGAWADHARGQIRKILSRERLTIAHRTASYHAPGNRIASSLALVPSRPASV